MTAKQPGISHAWRWPLLALLATAWVVHPAAAQQPDVQARIRAATTPGPQHAALGRFVGEWSVDLILTVPGAPAQHAPGHATYEWLIPGRWLAQRLTDNLGGEPHQSFAIIGYDNYAQSYVIAGVSSFDTALNVARGPAVTGDDSVVVAYGEQDDYTSGRLHKTYKIVMRTIDQDHHVIETWDMGNGAEGAKILEYRYTREH